MYCLRSDLSMSEIHQLLQVFIPPDVRSHLPGVYDFSCSFTSCSMKWPGFMVTLQIYPYQAVLNFMELVWPEDAFDEPYYFSRSLSMIPLQYLVDHGYLKEVAV